MGIWFLMQVTDGTAITTGHFTKINSKTPYPYHNYSQGGSPDPNRTDGYYYVDIGDYTEVTIRPVLEGYNAYDPETMDYNVGYAPSEQDLIVATFERKPPSGGWIGQLPRNKIKFQKDELKELGSFRINSADILNISDIDLILHEPSKKWKYPISTQDEFIENIKKDIPLFDEQNSLDNLRALLPKELFPIGSLQDFREKVINNNNTKTYDKMGITDKYTFTTMEEPPPIPDWILKIRRERRPPGITPIKRR